MLRLVYLTPPKKLWPGFSVGKMNSRLSRLGKPNESSVYEQLNDSPDNLTLEHSQCTYHPILDYRGKFLGLFASIAFCEKAFRDQLKVTTKFGNVWNIFKFGMTLFFFSLIIVLSGGANMQMDSSVILEIFGTWSIMEIAFNRGILASFKYGKLHSAMGISPKIIVAGIYTSVWLEICTLIAILNVWSIYKDRSILSFESYLGITFSLTTLFILTYPFSFFISMLSRNNLDLRFVMPVLFRFLVFTTPLFQSFHSDISWVSDLLNYSPLNLCFANLINSSYSQISMQLSYFVLVVVAYTLFFSVQPNVKMNKWQRRVDFSDEL